MKLQAAGGRENIRLGKPLDPHIHAKGLRGLLISSYIDLLEQVAPVLSYMVAIKGDKNCLSSLLSCYLEVVLILYFFFLPFNKWDHLYLPKTIKVILKKIKEGHFLKRLPRLDK